MSFVKYLVLLFALTMHIAYADDDCQVSMEIRKFDLGHEHAVYATLDKNKGDYIAIFSNGDMLLASFAICDLGLNAHYYSRKPLSISERKARLKWMAATIVTQYDDKQLKTLLSRVPSPEDGKKLRLGRSHEFVFGPAESPMFDTVLHYTWIPPEEY